MRPALRLYARLTRRGIVLLGVAMIAYVLVEVASYVQTYPDQAARERLAEFGDQPAVRMLSGIPHAVDTIGGFVVWDGGWFIQSLVAVWAILVTSRLLRGEEEAGRGELVGAGEASGRQLSAAGGVVVLIGCALAGAAVFTALVVPSADLLGAALYGAAVAGFGAVMAAVTAVASQLVSTRRRAAAIGAAVFGVTFIVRMIANSEEGREWVGWLSPFAWMDRVQPFADDVAWILVLYVVAAIVLGYVALALRASRDLGAALVSGDGHGRSRPLLLKSPVRFAWRLTWGVLLAWAIGIALYAFFVGSLIKAIGDVMTSDPTYQGYLDVMGLTTADIYVGMVAAMSVLIALVVSLYATWRLGAVRNEEMSDRAEHLLTRPLSRGRWLGGHIVLTAASVAALAVVNSVCMWVGMLVTAAPVGLVDTLEASINLLPVILVFAGLAVAMFGLAPRLTVAVPAAAAAVTYVLSFVGPELNLPGWVTGVSPFYHVALVPVADYELVQGVVMLAVAAGLTIVGWLAFQRRDVVSA